MHFGFGEFFNSLAPWLKKRVWTPAFEIAFGFNRTFEDDMKKVSLLLAVMMLAGAVSACGKGPIVGPAEKAPVVRKG